MPILDPEEMAPQLVKEDFDHRLVSSTCTRFHGFFYVDVSVAIQQS
jgi:hypothetical protein